jgi:hypothetical protein
MTGEEMAAWKRWHDLGRRRFQIRGTLGGLGLGLVMAFASIARYPNASPVSPLVFALVWSISCYFFAGHHWDARDEEYCWLKTRGDQA